MNFHHHLQFSGTGIDYCSHAPCMMHGICVPRQNKYHCICQSRYSGNNCEIDNGKLQYFIVVYAFRYFNNYCVIGSPCAKQNNRCIHGVCEEIKHGEDFICHCDKAFTGDYF